MLKLANTRDETVGAPLGTRDDWARLSSVGHKISSLITVNEPPEDMHGRGFSADEDYDDEDEQADYGGDADR